MSLYERYGKLEPCKTDIEQATELLIHMYHAGGKLLICGNGGSQADCEHIVGELMKGFLLPRRLNEQEKVRMKQNCPDISDDLLSKLQGGLPAVALGSFTALSTAFANDVAPEYFFAQAVFSLGKPEDVLLCISTSGNSKNCVSAAQTAKSMGLQTVALTGESGGKLAQICDITVKAPAVETYQVQEYHLPIYHEICANVERHFFGEPTGSGGTDETFHM